MGRWHEWRGVVDGEKPSVIKEAAEELAKVGFAVKKYFVNKHRSKFPSASHSPALLGKSSVMELSGSPVNDQEEGGSAHQNLSAEPGHAELVELAIGVKGSPR